MGVGWVEEGKGGKIGATVITIRINVIYKMITISGYESPVEWVLGSLFDIRGNGVLGG